MTRCGSCARPSGSWTCERCADWLADVLDPYTATNPRSIPWLYRHLGPEKVTGGDSDGRRPPGFRSTAPANTHQIALTDHRSKANGTAWTAADGRVHHEPAQGLLHAPTVLRGWLEVVRGHVGEPAPDPGLSCDALALALGDRLEDATGAEWCPDMVTELRTVHGQLDSALAWLTGRHRPRSIGRCAVEFDDGRCNEPLYVPRHGDAVSCRRCGSYWPRTTWEHAAIAACSQAS